MLKLFSPRRCEVCHRRLKTQESQICHDCWYEQASPDEIATYIKSQMKETEYVVRPDQEATATNEE